MTLFNSVTLSLFRVGIDLNYEGITTSFQGTRYASVNITVGIDLNYEGITTLLLQTYS